MVQSPTLVPVDVTTALDRFATFLACTGEAGLPGALALLVDSLGVRSAVLRSSGGNGSLLAVAGDVVQAVPTGARQARPAATVELPVYGVGGREVARLSVSPVAPGLLPGLRVAAAVLGLSLAAEQPGAVVDMLLAASEADLDELADDLHDGPVQDLVVARYATEYALRGGEQAAASEAVQIALVGLRRALWHVRPRGAGGLAAALAALSERLVEAGRRPLLVQLLPGGDDLRGSRAVVAYRLVQAIALPTTTLPTTALPTAAFPEPATSSHDAQPVSATLRGADGVVVVVVVGGAPLREPLRWRRRVHALGGDLTGAPPRLVLTLPVTPPETAMRTVPDDAEPIGRSSTGPVSGVPAPRVGPPLTPKATS